MKAALFNVGQRVVVCGYGVSYAATVTEKTQGAATRVKLDDGRTWLVANGLLKMEEGAPIKRD